MSNQQNPMPKFLCLQRSIPAPETEAHPAGGGGDMEAWYAKFQAWKSEFEANLVDLGGKLGAGTVVSHESKTDAPLVEVKDLVGGYMIVAAESLEEAARIAGACPGLVRPGSGVEVVEIHTP